MPFHLNLTLQQKATLSVAISVWNNQKVKDKIFKWCDNNLQKLKPNRASDEWEQLTEEVAKEVNQILLPSHLTGELIHVVKALGEKIYNWYMYISYEYSCIHKVEGDMTNYIREIYWTPIGTIDEVKILQEFWLKNPDLDVALVYNFACKNALEKDINDLWQKMPCTIQDCYDKSNRHEKDNRLRKEKYYDYFILAYWKYRTVGYVGTSNRDIESDNQFRYIDERVWHNQNYSQNYKMFLSSVYKGYNTAVKYFWKNLTQKERDDGVFNAAYLAVIHSFHAYRYSYIVKYMKEKYVEILIFLINQMTMNQIKSFLRKDSLDLKEGIFSILLCIWPWQDLFIPVLKNMLQYLEYDTLLEVLSEISTKIVKPAYAAENSKFQSILRDAWFIIPGSMKRMMVQKLNDSEFSRRFNFIAHLLAIGDLDSIKMIFNDPEITDVRMQYIKFGRKGYELLIMPNEYELLDQFKEEVLRSKEEKIYLKSLIDHIVVCKYLIETGKFDLVDKFLNWQFETVEERKQCKDHFANHEFTIELVITTFISCRESVDESKKRTSGFFEWLFESEGDVACFKKECIANSEPLIGRQIFDGNIFRYILPEEAQKIRQILA